MAEVPQTTGTRSAEAAPPGRRAGAPEMGRIVFDTVGPFVTIGALLITWETLAQFEIFHPYLLPALSIVAVRIVEDLLSGQLLLDAGITLYRTLIAFSLAAVIGVSIGILISRNVAFRWFFDPIVSIGLPMPKIALLTVFMLWFGLHDLSKILMVTFSASFQIIIATWMATSAVEKELIWSARSLGASERQVLWEVIMPGALPQILTGLQIAMVISLIVVLVTEMRMGGRGLGDAMLTSQRYVDSPGVFAGIVEIGLFGFAFIRTMEFVRRRLLVWHQEAAKEVAA